MSLERKPNEPVRADSHDEDVRDRDREVHQIDGEVEIDNTANVSRGDDDGAYVQAWVWVGYGE